jgi:steroid delta-isomerase-like uncharacterized protein
MSPEENVALVSRIWNEVWNQGKLDACDEILAPNYVGVIPAQPEPIRGPEKFKQMVAMYRTALPDVHLTVDDVFAVGDRVAVRWVSRGTNLGAMMGIPPTGKHVEVMGISLFQVAGGKVVAEWEGFDTFGMMQQLGLVPAGA